MKIGFIGLGIMGESMCTNIIKKHDDDVYVYDLVEAQVKKLVAEGGIACKDELEVAEKADVIISMVPTAKHSAALYDKILSKLGTGKYCIDMGTIEPSASVAIAEKVKSSGAQFVDAPVLKSKAAAISGELGIVVGGEKEVYDTLHFIFEYMGSDIFHMGKNGNGLVVKICANTMLAEVQNAVNETLCLAEKYGISLDDYAAAMALSTGSNAYLPAKKEALRNSDYSVAFSALNMAKDVNICDTMSKEVGLQMPGLQVSLDIYKWLLDNDYGQTDYASAIEVVRQREPRKA